MEPEIADPTKLKRKFQESEGEKAACSCQECQRVHVRIAHLEALATFTQTEQAIKQANQMRAYATRLRLPTRKIILTLMSDSNPSWSNSFSFFFLGKMVVTLIFFYSTPFYIHSKWLPLQKNKKLMISVAIFFLNKLQLVVCSNRLNVDWLASQSTNVASAHYKTQAYLRSLFDFPPPTGLVELASTLGDYQFLLDSVERSGIVAEATAILAVTEIPVEKYTQLLIRLCRLIPRTRFRRLGFVIEDFLHPVDDDDDEDSDDSEEEEEEEEDSDKTPSGTQIRQRRVKKN